MGFHKKRCTQITEVKLKPVRFRLPLTLGAWLETLLPKDIKITEANVFAN